MSGLITMRWIVDGEEIVVETVPHEYGAIEKLERSVEVTSYGKHSLKVEIEFDPPVICPSSVENVDA
jgi:hypothetical protein